MFVYILFGILNLIHDVAEQHSDEKKILRYEQQIIDPSDQDGYKTVIMKGYKGYKGYNFNIKNLQLFL